jgi:hypothetical protein
MAKRETIEKFVKEDYTPKVVEVMMGKLNEAEFKAKRKDDLNDAETEKIISNSGISKQDLAKVLQEVKNALSSNEAKAQAIQNIDKGVSAMVSIVKKLI